MAALIPLRNVRCFIIKSFKTIIMLYKPLSIKDYEITNILRNLNLLAMQVRCSAEVCNWPN